MINPCKEIMSMSSRSKAVVMSTGNVDGNTWYTITVHPEVYDWIKTQDATLYYQHITSPQWYYLYSQFDVHSELMLMIKLKWPN